MTSSRYLQTTIKWTQTSEARGKAVNLYVAPQSSLDWLTGAADAFWKTLFDSDHDDSGKEDWILIAQLDGK